MINGSLPPCPPPFPPYKPKKLSYSSEWKQLKKKEAIWEKNQERPPVVDLMIEMDLDCRDHNGFGVASIYFALLSPSLDAILTTKRIVQLHPRPCLTTGEISWSSTSAYEMYTDVKHKELLLIISKKRNPEKNSAQKCGFALQKLKKISNSAFLKLFESLPQEKELPPLHSSLDDVLDLLDHEA